MALERRFLASYGRSGDVYGHLRGVSSVADGQGEMERGDPRLFGWVSE